jgi:hypothetical protein
MSDSLAFDFETTLDEMHLHPMWSSHHSGESAAAAAAANRSSQAQAVPPPGVGVGNRVEVLEHTCAEHATRIDRLERIAFGAIAESAAAFSHSDDNDDLLQALRATDRSPTSPPLASTTMLIKQRCPMDECINRTGVDDKSPARDIVRHVRSRMHVEAALKLKPSTIHHDSVDFCVCETRDDSVTVDIAAALGVQRNKEISSFFLDASAHQQVICARRSCLRVVPPDSAAARDAFASARRRAADFLVSFVFSSDGSRKRRRQIKQSSHRGNTDGAASGGGDSPEGDELRGDQAVAIEFAARFSTPGACYLVFDAKLSQLRVQRERPAASGNSPFHVAHVARMHRWMEHVVHYAPRRHQFWHTHAAVADAGFVDAFVLVQPRVAVPASLDVDARRQLYERIVSEEVVLCAGRSDGWLELVRAADLADDKSLAHLIPLSLTHLQPHSFRLYDADAQPTLPLISEASANAPTPTFDVRLQHFAPQHVATSWLKLEFLCKVHGWQLVAQQFDDAARAYQRDVVAQQDDAASKLTSFLSIVELEAASQLALDAAAARQAAIDALTQAEQLRVANIALRQTLAEAERDAHAFADRQQHALIDHNNRLQAELAAAKTALADALTSVPSSSSSSSSPPPKVIASSAPTARTMSAPASSGARLAPAAAAAAAVAAARLRRPSLSAHFSICQSRDDVERELASGTHRFALYGKQADHLRLCVQLADGSFAHSKIAMRDGRYACVREISAASLEALLFDELSLDSTKPKQ